MEDLKITPEELRNQASAMKEKIEAMKESLQTATNVMGRTSDSFQGSAANETRAKYDALSPKFNDFYEAMTGYANFLEKTASSYDETNAAIQKTAEQVLTSEYDA